jgi:hypothetical protein
MKKWILMLIFVSLSAIILSSAIASEDSSMGAGPAPNSAPDPCENFYKPFAEIAN